MNLIKLGNFRYSVVYQLVFCTVLLFFETHINSRVLDYMVNKLLQKLHLRLSGTLIQQSF